ncbi:MAG: hypothetical protein HRF47_08865 [Chloroflexota bacterium]|nr:hypothetical protein [Chloroflexota bacterium]MBI5704517.1 hypothetical protein [Chloroflexota bacterium]MDL1944327.1 hypothetical protein [Chloroflexi bacterium CFX2]GER78873.1 conserved hypothetical protein [Candidatus Denitrolinea symbiosum]
MNALNILIEQMAADISSQALRLDNVRLRLFLEWLNAHSSKVKAANEPEAQSLQPFQMDIAFIREGKMEEELTAGLRTWFESLPMKGMLGEYHLILDEIAWWRDLDSRRLTMILRSEAGK